MTYKAATKQMIFLFQPCHMMCLVQLVLLAWPAYSNWLTYLYRVHLSFLQGVVMAVLLPVTNTLFLPGEVFVYWFEHGVLIVVALYLLRHGGMFTVEKFGDTSWSLMAYGMWGLYHFVWLELVSVATMANLNCMLCPAITDPIGAPNWRLVAIGHQYLLLLAAGKIFGLMGKGEEDVKEKPS